MIITCPACKTRYMVPAQKLGSIGRVVRCVRCQHEWHQEPPTQPRKAAPDARFPAGNASAFKPSHLPVPARAPKRRSGAVAFLLSVAFLVSVLGAMYFLRGPIMRSLPMMTALFEPLGMAGPSSVDAQTLGLTITDVERDVMEDDGFVTYVIQGKVTNTNMQEKQVPNLRVALLNDKGLQIDAWRVQPANRVLSPGESTTWICHFYNPPLADIAEYSISFTAD